jgi:hypothetical protein
MLPCPVTVLTIQAELRRPVRHERIKLDKRPRVQQQVQALPRGQLAERVLSLDPDGPPAEERLASHSLELLEPFVARGHVDLLAAPRPRVIGRAGATSYAARRNQERVTGLLSTLW